MLRIRDFIETKEGLIFSIVSYFHPPDRYRACLRYYPSRLGERTRGDVRYAKISTTLEAQRYLRDNYPAYIDNSWQWVPRKQVKRIYHPEERLREIMKKPRDKVERRVRELSGLFSSIPGEKKGVTGSILLGLHDAGSDIDFVVYGTRYHAEARERLKELLQEGVVEALSPEQWQKVYEKRFPGLKTLGYEEFLWHEKRKYHRGVIKGTVFDILLVREPRELFKEEEARLTLGYKTVKCRVIDASLAFDSPAVYRVRFQNGVLGELYSYTHTYAGQAFEGEVVEARGILQITSKGEPRLVVGTTREAEGEYIKIAWE